MKMTAFALAAALAVVESGAAVTVAVGPERELKSMTAARDWIRAERKAKRIAVDEKVEVVFDDGIYAQNDVRFSGKWGDDFVTYRAKNPHKAKLVTGTYIKGESFRPLAERAVPLNDANDAGGRLAPRVADKVFVAELAPYLKRDLAPIPDVLKGVPKPNLYVNGKEMTLARWPNLSDDPEKCWTGFRKVIDHGWADTNSPNAALRVPHAGSFVYEKSDRPNRWDVKKGVWLFGYWTHDWLDITVRLASWDPATKVMTHADKVQNGVGGGTLGRSERRFYALNVLSELDVPGEYYIDREAKLLYLYPTGELKGAEILLATDDGPTVKAERAKGLVFDGFTVMGSAGSAFGIGSCEDCVVSDCRFTCIGGLVLSLSGKRNLARNCEIFNVGQGGISVGGGDERTLTPGSNVVENCHIYNYAQHVRTYRPAIQLWGVGNVVRHNEMHDAPHNAMLFGGNDNVIEYNEIYRCVLETADSGALYTGRKWQTQGNVIRYNYIHDCGPKNGHIMGTVGVYFDDCDCGDAVYGNVFAHMGRAVFIGGGRDHPVENNVFYDCYNSIQMDNRGMEWKQWNTSRPSWNFEEQCENLNYKNPPWSVKYPRLANIMNDHPREPLHNPMRLNVFIYPKQNEIGCYPHVTNACPRLAPIERNLGLRRKGYKARNDEWRLDFGASVVLEDTPEAPYDLGFADLAKDDFTLREDAPLFKLLPGFQRVPFEKMGRLGKDGKAVRGSSSGLLKGDGDIERANDRSFL